MPNTRSFWILLWLAPLLLTACTAKKSSSVMEARTVKPTPIIEETLNGDFIKLFRLMQGSFNSEKQSIEDSSYYNISLHMYPIWEDRGKFLYVEQALSSMQDKPYRQRVYKLIDLGDLRYSSEVYKIKDDSLWIGKWKTPEAFDVFYEGELLKREGCEVILESVANEHYKGSTGNKTCTSTMRGARYADSQVEIFVDKIISWDRGFNEKDEHVWGAEKGGYVFDRITAVPR